MGKVFGGDGGWAAGRVSWCGRSHRCGAVSSGDSGLGVGFRGPGVRSGRLESDSGRRHPFSSRAGHLAQRVALACGVVALGLGLVFEPSAQAHDRDGGVGEAGEVAREPSGSDAGPVLVAGRGTPGGAPARAPSFTPSAQCSCATRRLIAIENGLSNQPTNWWARASTNAGFFRDFCDIEKIC